MLDQNTDRMWYVIGAVLIGAAIIFGASTMFPSAFASVGSNVASVISTIEYNIHEAGTDYIADAGDLRMSYSGALEGKLRNLQGEGLATTFDLHTNTHRHSGLRIIPTYDVNGLNQWNPEKQYKLSYTMTVLEGELNRLAHDIRGAGFETTGRKMILNGTEYNLEEYVDLPSYTQGDSINVELYFQPNDTVLGNDDRVAVYPNTNRLKESVDPIVVRFSNIQVEEY